MKREKNEIVTQPMGFLPTDPGDLWEKIFEGAGMAFEVQNTCGSRCR